MFCVKVFVDFIAHENFLTTKYFHTTVARYGYIDSLSIHMMPKEILIVMLSSNSNP